MSAPRHLLYVGDLPPGPGQGGRIVLDRHLRRLASEGWIITVATTATDSATGPWHTVVIPPRRPWWPPFRPSIPWLAELRSRAWHLDLRGVPDPDVILTVCWGPLSWLAAHIAEVTHRPLIAILHDHWAEGGSTNDALVGARACRAARVVLVVSEEMRVCVDAEFGPGKALVMHPLPAAQHLPFATWRPSHTAASVAHVGALHLHHEEFLVSVANRLAVQGGRLLVLCPRENPVAAALARRCPNLVRQDFFHENADALRWVAEHASALVVMYPHGFDTGGRPPTGFPSRLVEFTQLGLPILLAAPAGNPIRSWASRQKWTSHCDPADETKIDCWIRSLADENTWNRFALESRVASQGDFNAERIHGQFVAEISQ